MDAQPLIKEVIINAPAAEVWQAITQKDKMKEWYFDLAEFKPEVGFEFQFEGGKEDKCYLHKCVVTEVIEGQKLVYSWRYDGYEGKSFVSWELFDEGGKTRLVLTHSGLETFPANPDFARKNFEGGWNEIIGKSLINYLENTKK
ncbi:MAG: SRPBCC domain-containing protein [Ignavibacteria bacterium]